MLLIGPFYSAKHQVLELDALQAIKFKQPDLDALQQRLAIKDCHDVVHKYLDLHDVIDTQVGVFDDVVELARFRDYLSAM